MKVLHTNYVDSSGRIYCYHSDNLVTFDAEFIQSKCKNCPYYRELVPQGEGVVCEFDDACDSVNGISFDDAGDAELHSKMQYVRLGLSTKEEVLAKLKSFNDYSEPEANEEGKEEDTELSPETENLEGEK